MKIVWSRRALQHLVALRAFIAKDSEQNAALVAKRILDSISLLQTQPDMGRPGRVLGTRELVIPDTPYIIPYRTRRRSTSSFKQLEVSCLSHTDARLELSIGAEVPCIFSSAFFASSFRQSGSKPQGKAKSILSNAGIASFAAGPILSRIEHAPRRAATLGCRNIRDSSGTAAVPNTSNSAVSNPKYSS